MQKFTKEFKLKVVDEYQNGASCKELCTKYSIPKTCLYDWLKLYKVKTAKNKNSFTYEQYINLQKQLDKVKQELEIIKLSNCLPSSPIRQKQEAIDRLKDKFPIKIMCKVLELPSGTLFNYLYRRVKVTQNEIRDNYLKEEILKVFNESQQRFGSNKIYIKLKTLGINTTQSKVATLMKEIGIKSKQCKKKTFTPQKNKFKFCWNHLKRQFTQTNPNKFWVSDITMIRVASAKFYLCVIIDLFSRKVIAYRLSSQENSSLAVNTFKDAFEMRGRPVGLSFHSDQGLQYTNQEFRDLLHSLKVKQSFSNKGNPYDNAPMESFFSNLKREEINSHDFEYFEELQESVNSYMKYYNNYRPHQSLNNKTPNQVEDDYVLSVLSELSV